jgi:Uncharacterized protein conserved in bacteria (DUF2330)
VISKRRQLFAEALSPEMKNTLKAFEVANRKTAVLGIAILFFFLFIWAMSSVRACATIRGPSPTSEDYIQSEQAVIIWDEAHKTEHFIRQADISTKDSDLGFLVPTPTIPELVEVDPAMFQLAASVGRPKLVQETVYHTPLQIFGPVLRGPSAILALPFVSLLTGMSDEGYQNNLKIISEKDVAGYHAVIIAADNSAALAGWLKQNGYVSTPEIDTWLGPYVTAKWTITAFKLIKEKTPGVAFAQDDKSIITRALRMSFATDRPFYPYSEPQDKQKAHAASPLGRALRVAILSSSRMQGNLADSNWWPGDLLFSGSPKPIIDSVWKESDWLAFAKLDGRVVQPNTLTYWLDESNPRPGATDLYFTPAPDQSSFQKVEIDYSLPALHWIDFSHPLSDLAGLLIVVLLPSAPLYCGWKVIRQNRADSVIQNATLLKPRRPIIIDRIFGFSAVIIGSLNCISCLIAAYLLYNFTEGLPGKPLPAICSPPIPVVIAVLFWPLVYCGVRAFRGQSKTDGVRLKPSTLSRYWGYLMAADSILIGTAFSLAIVVALFISFSD